MSEKQFKKGDPVITGEQTLEEKVREILEPLGIRISDLNVSDQRIEFHAGVNRYSITSDTITREGCEFTLNEYEESRLNEDFRQCLPKVAALLTEQPEQTLEEAVRGILKDVNVKLEITYIHDDEVSVCNRHHQYWIRADKVTYSSPNGEQREQTHQAYSVSGLYHKEFKEIAALLSTRSTKPSYSELEQRVEELEEQLEVWQDDSGEKSERIIELEKQVNGWRDECGNKSDRITDLERENASLLDKFGPIDQAEQQVAEVETRFQKLAKKAERIADIMIQLNEEIL